MLLLHPSRPTSRFRPAPLNTIELQKRASKFLHMNSETTMKVYIY
jgi:DNA topoisomerase IA